MKLIIYIGLTFLFSSVALLAQEATCPEIVAAAMSRTAETCNNLGRNQACYGHLQIETQFREDMGDLRFEQTGDTVDVAAIERLNLSVMNTPDEWGVALMSIQANLPDTVPGQNVTLLLFGEVAIENMGEAQPPTIEITMQGNANVRSGPGTGYRITDGLVRETTVTATGRNEAGDWLQVALPEERGIGWIYISTVTTDNDLMVLDIVDPEFSDETGANFGAMEAFFFRSGIVEPRCAEAPHDGILMQTPAGVGEVSLLVNEVQIDLGSTVFVQAVPGGMMTVTLLEGSAKVTAQGVTRTIPVGAQAQIPLDENGLANDIPELVTYENILTQALPIELLPETIEVIDSLTDEELDEIVNTPILTRWLITGDIPSFTCPNGVILSGGITNIPVDFSQRGNILLLSEDELALVPGNTLIINSEASNLTTSGMTADEVSVRTLTVISSTEIQIVTSNTITFGDGTTCGRTATESTGLDSRYVQNTPM